MDLDLTFNIAKIAESLEIIAEALVNKQDTINICSEIMEISSDIRDISTTLCDK